jgi:hypothetical protein
MWLSDRRRARVDVDKTMGLRVGAARRMGAAERRMLKASANSECGGPFLEAGQRV